MGNKFVNKYVLWDQWGSWHYVKGFLMIYCVRLIQKMAMLKNYINSYINTCLDIINSLSNTSNASYIKEISLIQNPHLMTVSILMVI